MCSDEAAGLDWNKVEDAWVEQLQAWLGCQSNPKCRIPLPLRVPWDPSGGHCGQVSCPGRRGDRGQETQRERFRNRARWEVVKL